MQEFGVQSTLAEISAAEDAGSDLLILPEFQMETATLLRSIYGETQVFSGSPDAGGSGIHLGFGWREPQSGDASVTLAVPAGRILTLDPALLTVVDVTNDGNAAVRRNALENRLTAFADTNFTLFSTDGSQQIDLFKLPFSDDGDGGCGCDESNPQNACDPDHSVLSLSDLTRTDNGSLLLGASGDDGCGCEARLSTFESFMNAQDANPFFASDQATDDLVRQMWDRSANAVPTFIMVCDPD